MTAIRFGTVRMVKATLCMEQWPCNYNQQIPTKEPYESHTEYKGESTNEDGKDAMRVDNGMTCMRRDNMQVETARHAVRDMAMSPFRVLEVLGSPRQVLPP